MRRPSDYRRRQLLAQSQPLHRSPGARLRPETLCYIPADAKLRPLRDQIILEPLDITYSRYLYVHRDTKPLRGIAKAVGPGRYELGYKDAFGRRTNDRRKRVAIFETNIWIPMSVQVGDVLQLGGAEQEGYAFETFYWGDILHLHCTERDICGIESITEAKARAESTRSAA